MNLKEFKRNTLRFLGNHLLHSCIMILCKTLRIKIHSNEAVKNLQSENKNFVLAFWHGTMLIPWYIHRNNNFAALVSPSKDGELLYRLLKRWNYKVVRGSSNDSGKKALEQLVKFSTDKFSVAITPDGPKGPEFKMKAGAVITAKKTGIPIVMLGIHNQKKWKLKSWDKFEIPKFFSKVDVFYSEPFYIDKDLSFEQTSDKILQCEDILNKFQAEAGNK